MRFKTNYLLAFLCSCAAIITSCSVGNKIIPDPFGRIPVDTTASLGSFTLIVTGDTAFNTKIITDSTFNTIKDDSLIIVGADNLTATNVLLYFGTLSSEPGTYYVETTPPGITSALFLARIKINGVFRSYLMTHGTIVIESNDISTNTIRGRFDVNNEFAGADKTLFMRADFILNYKE
ncbi:MAG TPA: hypothetical protein PLJ42_08855 [Chitinophagales bacterium]|jgi:hypothetical protein|nr:hypothetical protein [Chitinophagales bacterium]MBP6154956.1 hypothetical protein [Chitinophagales bacterium]HQV78380.1 hypothetical protein [Chitinophagales bacterium]HQW79531.1 hypothetical protein [Chitinophagales bacterium]HRB18626.1 hypothetical protein [Chitinophagales bacterium]